jgi:hypothetical protein
LEYILLRCSSLGGIRGPPEEKAASQPCPIGLISWAGVGRVWVYYPQRAGARVRIRGDVNALAEVVKPGCCSLVYGSVHGAERIEISNMNSQ